MKNWAKSIILMSVFMWRNDEHSNLCEHISAICGIFTWSAFHISTILRMRFYLHLLRGCMGFHIWYLHYYVYHFYHCLFLCVWMFSHAGNFGKLLIGIQVQNSHEDSRITFTTALLRFVVKIFSILVFGLGILLIIFTKKHQGLHDLVAGTVVVREE